MGIIKEAKKAVLSALHTQPNPDEAFIASQFRAREGNYGIEPKNWYRIQNENGDCIGFMFCCACKVSYSIHSAFEWLKEFTCPTCQHKFSLLAYVGLSGRNMIDELVPELAKLPVRPKQTAKAAPTQRVIDTWGGAQDPFKNDTGWDGDRAAEGRADINNGLF